MAILVSIIEYFLQGIGHTLHSIQFYVIVFGGIVISWGLGGGGCVWWPLCPFSSSTSCVFHWEIAMKPPVDSDIGDRPPRQFISPLCVGRSSTYYDQSGRGRQLQRYPLVYCRYFLRLHTFVGGLGLWANRIYPSAFMFFIHARLTPRSSAVCRGAVVADLVVSDFLHRVYTCSFLHS